MTGGGSFEAFHAGSVSRLRGQLFLVTCDLHEAEEVVQEAFARASVRWSWLRTTTRPRLGAPGGDEPDPGRTVCVPRRLNREYGE
jgi:hypothetical protein